MLNPLCLEASRIMYKWWHNNNRFHVDRCLLMSSEVTFLVPASEVLLASGPQSTNRSTSVCSSKLLLQLRRLRWSPWKTTLLLNDKILFSLLSEKKICFWLSRTRLTVQVGLKLNLCELSRLRTFVVHSYK